MKLRWFLLTLVILWILWVLTGGPLREENHTRPFLEQPSPIESGQPYTLDELRDRQRR